MPNKDIIVIGASFGGISALKSLASQFPQNLPASVFIVQHLGTKYPSNFHEILSASSSMPVVNVKGEEVIQQGVIYLAMQNHHLLIKDGSVLSSFGPRVNRARPSIDALFQSAAAGYTTRVIAILLTGYLNDGVNGLMAVKRCGGTVIVQNPEEAEAPHLPRNAIEQMEVDHVLTLSEIGEIIPLLVEQKAAEPLQIPKDILEENTFWEHQVPDFDHLKELGEKTPFTCPECGGVLWEAKGKKPVARFFCHTGHSFSAESYLMGQADVIEHSLWSAARFLQERAEMLKKMSSEEQKKGNEDMASMYASRRDEMRNHALVIKRFIMSGIFTQISGSDKNPEKR